MSNKTLYKVTCMNNMCSNTTNLGIAYVVASDPTEAYNLFRKYLDDKQIGFGGDRALKSIEVIASANSYSTYPYTLILEE